MHAQSFRLCLTLHGLSMDCIPPGSTVLGIFQVRILEWVAMPSSWGSSQPRAPTQVSCVFSITGGFLTTEPLGKPLAKDS